VLVGVRCANVVDVRIALLAYGTRGDVQPLVALGHALQARGHDVVVGAPTNHRGFIERAGLRAGVIAGDSDELLDSDEGRAVLARGDFVTFLKMARAGFRTHAAQAERDVEALVADVDGIVGGVLIAGVARLHAELRRIPWLVAHLCPLQPSRSVPLGVLDVPRGLPGFAHEAIGRAALWGIWKALRHIDDEARDRRGLPRARALPGYDRFLARQPNLHLYSPTLVAHPPDWPRDDVVAGFCALPKVARAGLGETDALGELRGFLDDGPPPVFLGLGSMPLLQPAKTIALFVDVARQLGQRILIGGTFRDEASLRAQLPATARLCGAVDHDVLFPRCRAVLHHGGAGTTAASLRAGRPTMICPVLGDQHFWGRLVVHRGVGAMTPFRKLTSSSLTRGLATLLRPDVVTRAEALGATMRAEPSGADVAADAVTRLFSRA
jgi:UDP:flavonoid glycosyltransferase YjiC (YdhE family)